MICTTTLYTPYTTEVVLEGKRHMVYGIMGQAIPHAGESAPCIIPDITTEYMALARLILQMTKGQVTLYQMPDIVEDFLAQQ